MPLTTITFSMMVEYFYDFPSTERAINSISVFFIWLKSLYFLRMFRSSSKFISMIVAVVADMRIFLAVFLICLVTFSQSMLIISNNQESEEDKFIGNFFESMLFTYRLSLGDWDTSALGRTDYVIIITLFILGSFFLCIVMLNLLIAIISDTYAAVESTAQNELYKNFADLINENQFLIPKAALDEHDSKGSYLYIATIDSHEGALDPIEQRLIDLKRTMTGRHHAVDKAAQDFANDIQTTLALNKQKYS